MGRRKEHQRGFDYHRREAKQPIFTWIIYSKWNLVQRRDVEIIIICRCCPSLILSKQFSLKFWVIYIQWGREVRAQTVIGSLRKNNHRVAKRLYSLIIKGHSESAHNTEGQLFHAPWKMILMTVWLQFRVVTRQFWRTSSDSVFKRSYYHIPALRSALNEPQREDKLSFLIPRAIESDLVLLCV